MCREPGRSEPENGTRVAAETSRRLACDAAVVAIRRGGGRQHADPLHRASIAFAQGRSYAPEA